MTTTIKQILNSILKEIELRIRILTEKIDNIPSNKTKKEWLQSGYDIALSDITIAIEDNISDNDVKMQVLNIINEFTTP